MKSTIIAEEMMDNSHRLLMFKILLILIVFFGSFFVLLNIRLNNTTQIILIELFSVITSLCILLNFYSLTQKPYFKNLITLYMFIIAVFDGYIFSVHFQHSIQFWMVVIPLLSYLLLGKKSGFKITILFLAFSLCLYFYKHGNPLVTEKLSHSLNTLGTFAFVWITAHLYEDATFKAQMKLANIAATDHLTGLLNRNTLSTVFNKYNHQNCSLLLLDIDWFKKINDQYGHEMGDRVLVELSKLKEKFFLDKGYVFRVGGEEFCIFLPNTSKDTATKLANQFINDISELEIQSKNHKLHITCSIGVASFPNDATNLLELMDKADKNLYLAKHNGRNQVARN